MARLLLVFCFTAVGAGKLPIFLRPHHTGAVNASIDPCDNFYAYSCQPWLTSTRKPPFEPVWSPWLSAAYEIKRRVPEILDANDAILAKPRLFYRTCLTVADHEDRYLSDLISLVDDLGGWPLAKGAEPRPDWLKLLAVVTRLLGIHPVLKIHADLDYKNPTRHAIYIEPGNLIFPHYILADSDRLVELEAYKKWVGSTAAHLYGNETNRGKDVENLVNFETQLARIRDDKSKNERMTVGRLLKKIPLGWRESLVLIFGNQSKIDSNTTLMVKNYPYLLKLTDLVKKMGNRVVVDYLIWSVIKDLSRDTTKYMRKLNFLIDQAILGVSDDLSRAHECANQVTEFFSPALIPHYLKSYQKPHTFKDVTSMFKSIKAAFVRILLNSQWLTESAKRLSVEKVKNIKLNLGFPEWIFENGAVRRYYDRVSVDDNHFMNVLKLKQLKIAESLSRLDKKATAAFWPSTPFEVNAYYGILQNAIFIPLGLLQPPFFDPDRAPVYNYGALGSLIGHELSHSLDPTGLAADPSGRVTKWWPQNDLKRYKSRTECLKDDEMLGENIADLNGVRISLMALQNRDPARRTKPFFVSFAQMWCEIPGNSDIFTGDEHAPVSDRVANLAFDREFRRAFRCGSGDVCELW